MSELRRQLSAWVAGPMTSDTAVRTASVTKPVTAAATVLASRAPVASGGPVDTLERPVLDLLPQLQSGWRASPPRYRPLETAARLPLNGEDARRRGGR